MTMKEFEIKINEKDLLVLNAALVDRPYGEVAQLIHKLNQQLSASVSSAAVGAGGVSAAHATTTPVS